MYRDKITSLNDYITKAAEKTLTTMITPVLEKKSIELAKGDQKIPSDIIGKIDISGVIEDSGVETAFSGEMLLLFDKNSYLKIASAMLMEEYQEINDENDDVASELANMIAGNAKGDASEIGITLSMSSPETRISSQNNFNIKDGNINSALKIKTDCGDITLITFFSGI